MKLPELKNRLKNKYIVRVVAGVLTIALVGGGVGTYTVKAEKNDAVASTEATGTEEVEEKEEENSLEEELLGNVSVSKKGIDKEETVYLMSDASGNVDSTIVVNHLYNKDGKDTIEDSSSLSDIENVKGDETFTQDGESLKWQADGNDIYYQGTASAEAPVSQKVTYYLDGKEIAPEELAGKSGKVTIHFDYINNTEYTETVNGEKVTVSVPFAAMTALMLDDSFSNVEVTNGEVKENNGSSIVMGYALPGFADSLGVDDSDFSEDVTIPEYFEVTADVEDFSLSTAMTFVVNASNYVGVEGASLDSVDELLDELTDATSQLQDGSAELSEGADALAEGAETLESGMSTLKNGLSSYTEGANQINAGLNTLNGKVPDLSTGITTLNSSAKSLSDGVALLNSTLSTPFTDQEKLNLVSQVDSTIAAQKTAIEAQAAAAVEAQKSDIEAQAVATVDTQADAIKAQVGATVDAQADVIKAQVGATVDAQADTIKNNVATSVDASFDAGLTDQITAGAKAEITGNSQLMAVLTSGVQQAVENGFVLQVAELAKTIPGAPNVTDYATAVAIYDGVYGAGAADTRVAELVQVQVNTIVEQLAGSVAATTETVSKQVAGEAAVTASKTVAGEAAVETSKTVAGTAAVEASKTAAGAAAYAGASQAAGTAAYAGAVSGAEGAAVTVAEQTKATVVTSITAKQANGYSLVTGAQALAAGTQTLADSVPALTSGITQLVSGSNTLVSNNKTLLDGAKQLTEGTTKLSDGADALAEGSHTLADGVVEFNEKGISNILDAYNGDIKPLANKLQATLDAGADYQTYSGLADGASGSVKFVYKLASIEAESAE